mmetsp:Transcript_32234/g.90288  ORF Transcript_32234/g.90288 Transcript_32234/m.90288 type:complete len:201 (-) Transcript_32234:794-1396(-)
MKLLTISSGRSPLMLLTSLSQLTIVLCLNAPVTPPAAFCMLATVSEFRTTSIMPISSPVAMTLYGVRCRSRPSFFHKWSIMLSICSVSVSCRRSSPALKRTVMGSPWRSAFSNTNHSGAFALSMALHFSTMSPRATNVGSTGTGNVVGRFLADSRNISRSCSFVLRDDGTFFMVSDASRKMPKTWFCSMNTCRWSPQPVR